MISNRIRDFDHSEAEYWKRQTSLASELNRGANTIAFLWGFIVGTGLFTLVAALTGKL